MITGYFMAPVRGKDGDDVDLKVKWENIEIAKEIACWLQDSFPKVNWYIAHYNEEFVEALIPEGVSTKTIVLAFARIAAQKDFGVVFDGNGISAGMRIEMGIMKMEGRPLVYISETSDVAREQIAQVIASIEKRA